MTSPHCRAHAHSSGDVLNKLDISIAYEIPELLTKYKKQLAKAKLPEELPKDSKKETKKNKK
jgi:hypothetical protein